MRGEGEELSKGVRTATIIKVKIHFLKFIYSSKKPHIIMPSHLENHPSLANRSIYIYCYVSIIISIFKYYFH